MDSSLGMRDLHTPRNPTSNQLLAISLLKLYSAEESHHSQDLSLYLG